MYDLNENLNSIPSNLDFIFNLDAYYGGIESYVVDFEEAGARKSFAINNEYKWDILKLGSNIKSTLAKINVRFDGLTAANDRVIVHFIMPDNLSANFVKDELIKALNLN